MRRRIGRDLIEALERLPRQAPSGGRAAARIRAAATAGRRAARAGAPAPPHLPARPNDRACWRRRSQACAGAPAQAGVVASLLEQRQRRPGARLEPVGPQLLGHAFIEGGRGQRVRLAGRVADAAADPAAIAASAAASRGWVKIALARSSSQVDIDTQRPGERQRALEQRRGGALAPRANACRPAVASRSPAAGGRAAGRVGAELADSARPARGGSRGSRPARSGRCPCCSSQPAKRSCRSLGRLRQRLVGGVADQQVAEAEGVLADELRPVGADELLAHEPREPAGHLAPPRRAPAPRRDGRAGPRPSRTRARRARPGRAGQAGRRAAPGSSAAPATSSSPDSRASATICSTNSGLPSAAPRMPLAGLVRDVAEAARSALRLLGERAARAAPWSRSLSRRPVGAAVEQFRPRHAEQQDRRIARQIGDVVDQVEERLLAPVQVVENTDERPLGAPPTRATCERPRRSPRRVADARSSPSRPRASRRGSLRRDPAAQDLDDRPVRDALPVGEAAARGRRSHRRGRRGTRAASRDLPTPAGPRTVNSWHEPLDTTCSHASVRRRRARAHAPTIGARNRRGAAPEIESSRYAVTGSACP